MDLKEKTANKNRHPWELSRSHNLVKIFNQSLQLNTYKKLNIADIGAGDQYFDMKLIENLKEEGIEATIYAVDTAYTSNKAEKKDIVVMNDLSLLNNSSVDCILLMDVIEHVEDDSKFLKIVFEKLKPNGVLIITVPAFQFLYSSHDLFLNHFRRYDYKSLSTLLNSNGTAILRGHYFYFSLFLIRALQKLLILSNNKNENNNGVGLWKYGKDSAITKIIESLLNLDFLICEKLNNIGIRIPGLSLLVVASKS